MFKKALIFLLPTIINCSDAGVASVAGSTLGKYPFEILENPQLLCVFGFNNRETRYDDKYKKILIRPIEKATIDLEIPKSAEGQTGYSIGKKISKQLSTPLSNILAVDNEGNLLDIYSETTESAASFMSNLKFNWVYKTDMYNRYYRYGLYLSDDLDIKSFEEALTKFNELKAEFNRYADRINKEEEIFKKNRSLVEGLIEPVKNQMIKKLAESEADNDSTDLYNAYYKEYTSLLNNIMSLELTN